MYTKYTCSNQAFSCSFAANHFRQQAHDQLAQNPVYMSCFIDMCKILSAVQDYLLFSFYMLASFLFIMHKIAFFYFKATVDWQLIAIKRSNFNLITENEFQPVPKLFLVQGTMSLSQTPSHAHVSLNEMCTFKILSKDEDCPNFVYLI